MDSEITKTALIPAIKGGVFNRAVFGIRNWRTKVRGIKPRQFPIKFSGKFYLGAIMVVSSLVLGKISAAVFILYLDDVNLRWISMIIYILTWPLLFLGIWWVGKEYYDSIRRYASYRFYHESLRK